MQILEQIAQGDYVLTEGLFKSSASDSDYKKFIDVAEYLVKIMDDEKDEDANLQRIQKSKSKKRPNIAIKYSAGKPLIDKIVDGEKERGYKSVTDIIITIGKKYGLSVSKWVATYTYGVEISRDCHIVGKLGDSYLRISVVCCDYGSPIESANFTLHISNMTKAKEKQIAQYNKL